MSILSQLVNGKITLAQAAGEAETWLGQAEASIEAGIKSDPAVAAAVNAVIADGKAALSVGADWAGTAISGQLGAYAAEAAALVAKYAPLLAGVSGGPLSAAAVTALQALGQVGVAVVQHEVASIVVGPSLAGQAPKS